MEDTASATAALLSQLSKLVKGLNDDQVRAILGGETRIMLVPKGSKVLTPFVPSEVAEQLRRLADQDQIIRALDADKRLNAAALRQVAGELNITVPSAAKTKAAIQLYLAQTLTEYRHRNHGGI